MVDLSRQGRSPQFIRHLGPAKVNEKRSAFCIKPAAFQIICETYGAKQAYRVIPVIAHFFVLGPARAQNGMITFSSLLPTWLARRQPGQTAWPRGRYSTYPARFRTRFH